MLPQALAIPLHLIFVTVVLTCPFLIEIIDIIVLRGEDSGDLALIKLDAQSLVETS